MYYVNHEQMEQRLQFIEVIIDAVRALDEFSDQHPLLQALAEERILHLAIETVTDIGSFMIDGLLMREASSYEDIIEVLFGEGVYKEHVREVLIELVQLRKPLVQQYYTLSKTRQFQALLSSLPAVLLEFKSNVRDYLNQELA